MSNAWTEQEETLLVQEYKRLAREQASLEALPHMLPGRSMDSIRMKIRALRGDGILKHYDEYGRGAAVRVAPTVHVPNLLDPTRWMVRHTIRNERAYVVPIGDIHWGHPTVCNNPRMIEKLYGYRDWILDTEDAYTICMGDNIENSTRSSVGSGVYEQIMDPMRQVGEMIEFWRPVAEAGKILGFLDGNHERRTFNVSGIDVSRVMATTLGVPYLEHGGFVVLDVGNQTYKIHARHGATGSTVLPGKMRACEAAALVNDADIYCMGHVHDLAAWVKIYRGVDLGHDHMVELNRHFVLTGHFLGYEGSYAEMKGYQISKSGAPKIRLNGKRRDIHIST